MSAYLLKAIQFKYSLILNWWNKEFGLQESQIWVGFLRKKKIFLMFNYDKNKFFKI